MPDSATPDLPHPEIEIRDVEPVDRTHHRLTVEVGPGAELIESATLAYDVSGRAPGPVDEPCRLGERAEDLYGITAPSARYLAHWQTVAADELAWLAAWLGADGSVQRFLGPPLERGIALPTPEAQVARCAPILEDASGRPGALALAAGGWRFEVTTSPAAPASTALGPWAEIETDAAEVIRLEDRRALAASLLPLTASGTVTGTGVLTRLHVPASLQVDEVLVSLETEPDVPLAFGIVEAGGSRLVAGTEPAFDVGSPLLSRSAIFTAGRCHVGTVLELHAMTAPASPVGFSLRLLGLGG